MKIINTPREMRALSQEWRCAGESIGFVPTMGALHEGHLSLAQAARRECNKFVASIFVNPTQFGPDEDFAEYARPFERDCALLEEVGCDAVFAPAPQDIYGAGGSTASLGARAFVEVGGLSELWEGATRPGHLRGVATVVAILFNVVRPTRAYFGEKDFQQLKVVEQMVHDLHFDLQIVPCETVRDADGLAMSSRNARLSPAERQAALLLSRALRAGVEMAHSGECDTTKLGAAMQAVCSEHPAVEVQYIAVVDAQTLATLPALDGRPARTLIAARVGSVRLIDNVPLN